jgi:DNA-binding response OmpR family regulator
MADSSAKILLVEDDESLRQMYSLILSKEGYQMETAGDGVDGLTKARAGGYRLILLDLMMPNLDGIGFLKGLREEPAKAPNGPIVILSNAGYEKVADEVAELGAQGFLMKADLLPDDLIKAVGKYVK